MPLKDEKDMGTNKEGSGNNDFCINCYKDGSYVEDVTMDEMIEISIGHIKESGILDGQGVDEEQMREFMGSFYPSLKRWQN